MKPGSAKARFLKRLEATRHSLDALTPTAGIETMLEFYAEERADGCDPEDDGDMLLFQWGVNDWGDGAAFEVNITRQFIVSDGDEPRQLSLTFRFDPGAAPSRLKGGNKWCESVEGLAKFRRFVAESRAVLAVGQQSPSHVTLKFGRT